MRPVWLIEAGVYGDEAAPLLGEIRRQGMRCAVIPQGALKEGFEVVVEGCPLGPCDCVVGYGTYPFARQIQLHHRWVPGAWCHPDRLDCARYYAYFGEYLLNQDYAIMPGVEAIRRSDWIFSTFGGDDGVFARPTGCHKIFVGRLIAKESFATALAPTRYDPETLVVVASPRAIGREWRLVVVGDRIVSGGRYAVRGERAIDADFPDEVRSFAAAMLAEVRWRPDPVFMLDVCESAGRLWLVELNSFSSSWLYRCDLTAVVEATSEQARHEWVKGAEAVPPGR